MRVAEWKICENSRATGQTDDNVPRLDRNEIPSDITVRIHGQSGGEVGQGAVNPRDKIGGRRFFFFFFFYLRSFPSFESPEGHHLLLSFPEATFLTGGR